jgi:2-dehydro-3-deoxygalactonokinase
MNDTTAPPRLIALDWGTSSLRAYLLRGPADVADTRSAPWGILHLPADGFAGALRQLCGDWITRYPAVPVIASGMVGSAQGWREASYALAPAGLTDLASALVSVAGPDGKAIAIVPGVRTDGAMPNVMRGEETQVFGTLSEAGASDAEELLVLPGTHSKWVVASDGKITDFLTFMTGELFAVLSRNSILGRLMPPTAAFNAAAFEQGLKLALDQTNAGPLSTLFSVRSLGLTGKMPHTGLADYLSGLLIGYELTEAKRAFADRAALAQKPLHLIGDESLCERYRRALPLFGFDAAAPAAHAPTPAGLWRVALAAGLISTNEGASC